MKKILEAYLREVIKFSTLEEANEYVRKQHTEHRVVDMIEDVHTREVILVIEKAYNHAPMTRV